jgi:ABC-type polysaccharide/polyol phosphate export permease
VDYLQFLLVGTILWQWIQTTLHLSATSILDKPHLLRQIKVPLALFPISKVIANTVKFFVIYSLLLVYLVVQGYIPTPHWLSIIPLLILHAALLISLAIPLALLTPFAPDLKTVLDAALRFLMLLSGIFFTSDKIPQHLILYFYSNPIVHILESHRLVLLYGSSPTYYHWLYPLIIIILLIPFNLLLLRFSDGRIPKILK